MRARYYDPAVGCFTQEDVHQGDGLNLYAYCHNSPVRYCDPSGYSIDLEGILEELGSIFADEVVTGKGNSTRLKLVILKALTGDTTIRSVTEPRISLINGLLVNHVSMRMYCAGTPWEKGRN